MKKKSVLISFICAGLCLCLAATGCGKRKIEGKSEAKTGTTSAASSNTPRFTSKHSEATTAEKYSKDVKFRDIYDENKKKMDAAEFSADLKTTDSAYAKTWVSDDKKLSIEIDTKYGPLGDGDITGTYTVKDKKYDINGYFFGSAAEKNLYIYYETIDEDKTDAENLRTILQGKFTYDSGKNTISVKADKYTESLEAGKEGSTVPIDKYGDKSIPVYSNGETVTFSMK